jgi:hypothetical protein
MKLVDIKVNIGDIYLDPYNPRFTEQENITQEQILEKILNTKAAKELLNSLKVNIKWVNKIVVIKKEHFSELQSNIINIDQVEYLVVEGNNRLACLKSGSITDINENYEIPVILAEKEESETEKDFITQLRITQGIANVMVVKEWSVLSKARHLHNMYNDIKLRNENKDKTPHEIYKKISAELGIGTAEVRQSIIRYEFFSTINLISDKMPEGYWGYLEAFDRTVQIRKKFGMNDDTNILDINGESDESDYIKEVLQEIPSVIKKANEEGINTKQFRDIISNEMENLNAADEILTFFNTITENESEYRFKNELVKNNELNEEEKWKNKFNDIYKKLELFPSTADWAKNYKNDINKIINLLNKNINILELDD